MAKQRKGIIDHILDRKYFLLLPFAILIFFLLDGVNLPFVGYNAWNFNTYSLIAHNYNQFGLLETKLAPVISVAEYFPATPEYYLHHPQLLSIIISFIFNLLGESFWTARLTVIFFALASMGLIYLVAKELFDIKAATIAVIIYSLLPASVLFGRMIGQESILLFFVLLAVFSLLCFIRHKKNKYLLLLYLSIILGTLSDWPMVYFTLCIFPYLWIKKEAMLGVRLIIASVMIALVFIFYISTFGNLFSLLFGAFLVRSPGALLEQQGWIFRWSLTIITRLFFYFNPLLFFIALVSLVQMMRKVLAKKIDPSDILILSFVTFGLVHVFLYPEGSFGHPYWIYYLLPGIVLLITKYFSAKVFKIDILLLVMLFSFIYLLGVNTWKKK